MEMDFIDACASGNITKVLSILNNYNINVHAYNEYAFRIACSYGQIEIVKLLLSNDNKKYNIVVHAKNDDGFKRACEKGCMGIAKILAKYNNNYILITDDNKYKIIKWEIKEGNLYEKYKIDMNNKIKLDINNFSCSICFDNNNEDTDNKLIKLNCDVRCKGIIHIKCLHDWLNINNNNKCVYCKNNYNIENSHIII